MAHTCHPETQPAESGPLLGTAWYRVKYVQYSHLCEGFCMKHSCERQKQPFFFFYQNGVRCDFILESLGLAAKK